MKTFKGTKCKWHAIEYAGQYQIQSGAYYGDMNILDYENFSKEEVDANAKLIAAAPKLLETLIDVKQILEAPGLIDAGDLRRIVNSAINKALGQ